MDTVMDLAMKPFEPTDAQYELVSHLEQEEWPEWASSPEELREEDERRESAKLYERTLFWSGQVCIGSLTVWEPTYKPREGKFGIGTLCAKDWKPRGAEEPILEAGLKRTAELGAKTIQAYCRSDSTFKKQALLKLGFEDVWREPITGINLTAFEPSVYDQTIAAVRNKGIRLCLVRELEDEGFDWMPKLYALRMEAFEDVPDPDLEAEVGNAEPYEVFVKKMTSPSHSSLDNRFVALDGAEIVGATCLYPCLMSPTMMSTGLTAVARTHRRRGIATALKAMALANAKQRNAVLVTTGNAESNPMLGINLRLGFKVLFAIHTYQLTNA